MQQGGKSAENIATMNIYIHSLPYALKQSSPAWCLPIVVCIPNETTEDLIEVNALNQLKSRELGSWIPLEQLLLLLIPCSL